MDIQILRRGEQTLSDERKAAIQAGNGRLRAPHCTVSGAGLLGELAIAAGGTLILDEAEAFRGADLLGMFNTWAMMHPMVRPRVVMIFDGDEAAALRLHKHVDEARRTVVRFWG